MSRARHVQLSKRMSFLLRHRPQSAGLELDGAGWIGVDDFLRGVNSGGSDFTLADVEEVIATSDKRRFELADGRIRAQMALHATDTQTPATMRAAAAAGGHVGTHPARAVRLDHERRDRAAAACPPGSCAP